MQVSPEQKARLLSLQAEIEQLQSRWRFEPSASLRKEIQAKIAEWKQLEAEIEAEARCAVSDREE